MFFFVCLALFVSQSASRNASVEWNWRNAERDAINCSFVLLECHGKHLSYEELRDEFLLLGRSASMLDIKHSLNNHGIEVQISNELPENQLFQNCPALIQLRDERAGGAQFSVLIEKSLDSVAVFYGGTARIRHLSWDEFRRSWTGISMFETPRGNYGHALYFVALAIFIFTGYLVRKYWRLANDSTTNR